MLVTCLLLNIGCFQYRETNVQVGLMQIEQVLDCEFPKNIHIKLAKLEHRGDTSYAEKFQCGEAELQNFVSSFKGGLNMDNVKYPWSKEKEPILKSIKWWQAHLVENSKMGVINDNDKEFYISTTVSKVGNMLVYSKSSFTEK